MIYKIIVYILSTTKSTMVNRVNTNQLENHTKARKPALGFISRMFCVLNTIAQQINNISDNHVDSAKWMPLYTIYFIEHGST